MKKADLKTMLVPDLRTFSSSKRQRLASLFDGLAGSDFERLPGNGRMFLHEGRWTMGSPRCSNFPTSKRSARFSRRNLLYPTPGCDVVRKNAGGELRAAHGRSRLRQQDLVDDEPVAEHADQVGARPRRTARTAWS